MFSTLSKSAIWPATVIVLAIVGCVTWLCVDGKVAGSDVLTTVVLILTGVVGLTTAHATGQATINALQSTPVTPVIPAAADLVRPGEAPAVLPGVSAMPGGR